MGSKTFERRSAKAPGRHAGMRNYIFPGRCAPKIIRRTSFVSDDAFATVAALREEKGGDIWLVGGGLLFRSLLRKALLTRWR